MKILITIAAIALAVVSANAASVAWKVTGSSIYKDYTAYVLTSLSDSYTSATEIANDAISNGKIAKSGVSYTTGNVLAASEAVTKASMSDAYIVLVNADASSYTFYGVDWSANVYDPAAQESQRGISTLTAATIMSSGTTKSFASVPEPTSGLLLLVGMAGLALRRKQK